jgi:glutamyl/glutaminyl-tRNA synthetase
LKELITRFAPSPTGDLHLGHVLHARYLWDTAARLGGRVLVRIEDHERARCTPAFEASILDDLDWLGFGPDAESRMSLQQHPSEFRQSDHPERYQAAFDQLRDAGLLYGCTCSRATLAVTGAHGERCYPGHCRGRPVDLVERHMVRVMLPDDAVAFDDLKLGRVAQRPATLLGDVAIRDANGQWTYQFCVVVDDLHDRVDLVVRGEDLITSTGTQLLLAGELGRTHTPATLHHPLLYAADGRKLGKRDRSETVKAMRKRGMTRDDVVERALAAV